MQDESYPLFKRGSPERTARELQAQITAAENAYHDQNFLLCAGLLHAAGDMATRLHTNRPNPLYRKPEPQGMMTTIPTEQCCGHPEACTQTNLYCFNRSPKHGVQPASDQPTDSRP